MTKEELEEYENFISLGYFCEVARDLERLGLRNTSSPFDWSITSFEGVIEAISNKFQGFMEYENLAQSTEARERYIDLRYGIFFFHDFTKYKTLKEQYSIVKEKYCRRINRFLKNIESPTLFVRYISNERKNEYGKSTELQWIEENSNYINEVLQRYNSKNRIIYIGDEDTRSNIVKIYNVKVDDNDIVSRSPIISSAELYSAMRSFDFTKREENKKRFAKKQRKKVFLDVKNKISKKCGKYYFEIYIHSKEYDKNNNRLE